MAEWNQNKKSDFERVFQALEDLDQKYVVFHLLQTCMGWSQLNYLDRTAPRYFLVPLLDWYDTRYREVFEVILGERITDIQWLQATFSGASEGLGLTTEKILLGDQVFGRTDLTYVIACRARAPLIEVLVPPRADHSRIDWAPAVQRLTQIFPTWQFELENPDFRPQQKDLIEIMMLSFRRATSDLLSDLQKTVFQAFAAPWADGWVRASPSHAFDTYLSNAAFYDILSMRLGRQILEDDMVCPRYPHPQDSFRHHIFAYHMLGGKSILHNMIRDEIYRTLQEGNLHYRLEPNHLLPDSPGQHPADILTIPPALSR